MSRLAEVKHPRRRTQVDIFAKVPCHYNVAPRPSTAVLRVIAAPLPACLCLVEVFVLMRLFP
jgi:hypothetical protein